MNRLTNPIFPSGPDGELVVAGAKAPRQLVISKNIPNRTSKPVISWRSIERFETRRETSREREGTAFKMPHLRVRAILSG
jgi:hypothetical protein